MVFYEFGGVGFEDFKKLNPCFLREEILSGIYDVQVFVGMATRGVLKNSCTLPGRNGGEINSPSKMTIPSIPHDGFDPFPMKIIQNLHFEEILTNPPRN
jgi:hypothetical protein